MPKKYMNTDQHIGQQQTWAIMINYSKMSF